MVVPAPISAPAAQRLGETCLSQSITQSDRLQTHSRIVQQSAAVISRRFAQNSIDRNYLQQSFYQPRQKPEALVPTKSAGFPQGYDLPDSPNPSS
jgi:hypothetical protein